MRQSEKWPGLEFYYMPDIVESKEYKQLLANYNLIDNFGYKMVEDGERFNIAFLRTVSGKGEIQLNRELPFALVADRLKMITQFLKNYYEEYLTDYKVTGSVQIEV